MMVLLLRRHISCTILQKSTFDVSISLITILPFLTLVRYSERNKNLSSSSFLTMSPRPSIVTMLDSLVTAVHTKSNVQKRTRQASACVQFHVASVQNIYAYVHSLVFKLQVFNIWSVQNELYLGLYICMNYLALKNAIYKLAYMQLLSRYLFFLIADRALFHDLLSAPMFHHSVYSTALCCCTASNADAL